MTSEERAARMAAAIMLHLLNAGCLYGGYELWQQGSVWWAIFLGSWALPLRVVPND